MRIDYIKEIKRLVSVRDVADRYSIETNPKGFTHCLFHSEKTASMKIYPDSRGFYCFGCGKGGDCVDFVMKLFDLSLEEAAKKINAEFNLGLPIDGRTMSAREKERIGRQLYEQRKKRLQAEKERKQLFEDWVNAYAFWAFCDIAKRKFKPSSADEEPSTVFLFAIKNLERAENEIEEVETRRWLYDRRNC